VALGIGGGICPVVCLTSMGASSWKLGVWEVSFFLIDCSKEVGGLVDD
jgi:hypothetical protein